MKNIIVLILTFLVSSCSTQDCSGLLYKENLTYLNKNLYSGKCKSFYESGKIKSSQEYFNGKDNGKWTFYYENGQIETLGLYANGIREGSWEYFYESGTIKQESYYEDGKAMGTWKKYYENGQMYWAKGFN
jgi:antitoxin component YwqK of YwqJK toxin-antitoxin module